MSDNTEEPDPFDELNEEGEDGPPLVEPVDPNPIYNDPRPPWIP